MKLNDGVDLRDYFAAQVMNECLRRWILEEDEVHPFCFGDAKDEVETVAWWSYWVADAMMKVRSESNANKEL